MKTKIIYLFDTKDNTITKIDKKARKKARKKAKKILKRRALETRIINNAEKATAFDAYMRNKKRLVNKTKRKENRIMLTPEVELFFNRLNSTYVSTLICWTKR